MADRLTLKDLEYIEDHLRGYPPAPDPFMHYDARTRQVLADKIRSAARRMVSQALKDRPEESVDHREVGLVPNERKEKKEKGEC